MDSNILESARQELEEEKIYEAEKRNNKVPLEPIKEHKEEHKNHKNNTQVNIDKLKEKAPIQEVKPNKQCHHSTIQPVFDCIYCAKSNIVVDKLIHRNLINKYKENELNSLELSIKTKKFDNPLITTTLPINQHSTAVTAGYIKSASALKPSDSLKFYSLSNSEAKIKLEKQNTFSGKL